LAYVAQSVVPLLASWIANIEVQSACFAAAVFAYLLRQLWWKARPSNTRHGPMP
jgi:hypothetical protein